MAASLGAIKPEAYPLLEGCGLVSELFPRMLPCRLRRPPSSVDDMAEGESRMPVDHAGAREAHYGLHPLSTRLLVAVNRAIRACRLVLKKRTLVHALRRVFHQLPAIMAEEVLRAVVCFAVHPYHEAKSPFLSPGSGCSHVDSSSHCATEPNDPAHHAGFEFHANPRSATEESDRVRASSH